MLRDEPLGHVGARCFARIAELLDARAYKRFAFDDFTDPEPLSALDHDFRSPVLIGLHDVTYQRRAADIFQFIVLNEHDAERRFRFQAVADQRLISVFEYVEWQRFSRIQDDSERKERYGLHGRPVVDSGFERTGVKQDTSHSVPQPERRDVF